MNSLPFNRMASVTLALLLAACGTPPAKDFGGRWVPINRLQRSTTEIPLDRPYTYYASPMDETLRNMLQRWATDTGMTLVYRLPSDYTLFDPVAKVRTPDIRRAAMQLNDIYATQGVAISIEGTRLQVGRVRTLGSGIPPIEGPGKSQPLAPSPSPRSATGAG